MRGFVLWNLIKIDLLLLAFLGESNPNFPREKINWDNSICFLCIVLLERKNKEMDLFFLEVQKEKKRNGAIKNKSKLEWKSHVPANFYLPHQLSRTSIQCNQPPDVE